MGIDTTKIRSSRSTGILLAPSGIFVTYNSSSALMKWRYKWEIRGQGIDLERNLPTAPGPTVSP